jgi:AraC-like DNA-binding protein
MYKRSICKFPNPTVSDGLLVHKFVLESDKEVMQNKTKIDYHRVMLINKGGGIFVAGGMQYDISAGMLIFAFVGEEISVIPNDECAFTYIDFSGQRADELLRRFEISRLNRVLAGFDGIIPFWNESLSRADAQSIDLVTESILLYTFSRITAKYSDDIGLINNVLRIIEQSFSDPNLSIADIAKELSYNPKYLSHLFKERVGLSYGEYLKNARIKYAVSLFDRGLDSIKNVAFLSGYNDPLYFSSVFKKSLGMSPKEYIFKKRLNKDSV